MKTLFFICILSVISLIDTPMEKKFQAGEEVNITTAVHHNLYAAGGKITVSAPVRGDLMAVGGSVIVRDRIDGDLIVMGGDVTIDQAVIIGQDLVVMAGQVSIHGDVAGSMMARGGKLTLEGVCQGDLDIQGGEAKINGTVRGVSTLAAESIALGADAKLYGHVNYWTEEGEVDFTSALMEGAQASFDDTLSLEESSFWVNEPFAWFPFMLAYLLSALLVITLLHILLPKVMEKSGSILNREAARSFGYGALYFLAVPVAVVLLLMSS